MNDIYYEIEGNIVKARFTKPWSDKFAGELLKLKIYRINMSRKLKDFVYNLDYNYDKYGRAKCHPADKFDIEFGKKLARKRLLKKYNRMRYLFFRELDKYIASYRSIISSKRDKYFLASEGDYHA